jgi:preprotein translocase subunit Sec61beta
MAKDNEATMPSGQGGLVQYFDSDTGYELDPRTIVGICIGVAVVELALHSGILGI